MKLKIQRLLVIKPDYYQLELGEEKRVLEGVVIHRGRDDESEVAELSWWQDLLYRARLLRIKWGHP